MRTTNTTHHSGFTLVEVMVALTILTLGLLGVATMISRSTIQDARAYYLTQASMIAEDFIENSTRLQYDDELFSNMNGTTLNNTIDGVNYTMNCTLTNNVPFRKCNEMNCTIQFNNKGINTTTEMLYVYTYKTMH